MSKINKPKFIEECALADNETRKFLIGKIVKEVYITKSNDLVILFKDNTIYQVKSV